MMNGNASPPDGNTSVSITFTLNVWNQILSLVVKGSWEVADPLVREIHSQINRALERSPDPGEAPEPAERMVPRPRG